MIRETKIFIILSLFLCVLLLPCLSQTTSEINQQPDLQDQQLQNSTNYDPILIQSDPKTNDLLMNELDLFPSFQTPMENSSLSQPNYNNSVKQSLIKQLNTVSELKGLTTTYTNTIESILKESSNSAIQWREQSELLQKHVDSITLRLNEVVEENKNIEAALISNNEDSHNTNLLFGESLIKIDELELKVLKLEKAYKNSVIGFSVCGAGIGLGTGVLASGINTNDFTKIAFGLSIDLVSIGTWLLGHYVFKIF